MATRPPNFHEVTSPEHFQALLSEDLKRVSLLSFWAPWAGPCIQMNEVVLELAKKYPHLLILQIEADSQPDISESFDVEAVPSFVVLRGHTLLERISGADAAALTQAISAHARSPSSVNPLSFTDQLPAAPKGGFIEEEDPEKRIRKLMVQSKVMLFMKGEPNAPRCGFSRRMVALLRENNVEFSTFDILEDESVRSGLKVINDWPTFPQLIINGEFVGGLDVVTEMAQSGELAEVLA
ncbi:glutaredoxin [Artomyces pyxidatus]|uniref:Glutaredoxin n=1 Tax=Artomyces pyxidatus TaxID=48021 RepID=A0ACB8T808_9AGAM|nr:glutaredoxin [Artomyces pyxidatus]